MKETLKKLYKDAFIENVVEFNFEKYYYFLDEKEVFAILKSVLSTNELHLILSQYELLSEAVVNQPNSDVMDFLFGKKESVTLKQMRYYFIKFMNINDEETYHELNTLLSELFHENTYFFKQLNIYILIIEKDIDIQFMDVLKSIESDFLIQMVGYESDLYAVNLSLPEIFQFDFEAFQAYTKTNELIIHKIDLIQNKLLFNVAEDIKKQIKSYILKDFINDTEMINVIKMYFKTNFNLTLAAKKCYMHRNTFINKIDKFIEQTHFNLRQYDEAYLVYLALVL